MVLETINSMDNTELKEKYRKLYHQHFLRLTKTFPRHGNGIYEIIINAAEKAGNALLESEKVPLRHLHKLPILPSDRQTMIVKYGIHRPDAHIAYRGGYARVIGRELLNLAQAPGDMKNKDRDCDIYIDASSCPTDKNISMENCAEEGKLLLDNFSWENLQKIIHGIDCNINEIIVTRDMLYYTQDAYNGLKDGIVKPTNGTNLTLLSHRNYEKNGEKIFTGHTLYRIFKFLIHQKSHTATLPSHNLAYENMHTLEAGKYMLVLARQICQLPKEEQQMAWYRFGKIMVNIGVWPEGHEKSIFFHMELLRKKYPEVDIVSPIGFDIRQKANRMMRKYMRLINTLEHGPSINLDTYNLTPTNDPEADRARKNISLPYETIIDPSLASDQAFVRDFENRYRKISTERERTPKIKNNSTEHFDDQLFSLI